MTVKGEGGEREREPYRAGGILSYYSRRRSSSVKCCFISSIRWGALGSLVVVEFTGRDSEGVWYCRTGPPGNLATGSFKEWNEDQGLTPAIGGFNATSSPPSIRVERPAINRLQ